MAPLHLLKAQIQINQTHLPCGHVWEHIWTVFLVSFYSIGILTLSFLWWEDIYCLNVELTAADFIYEELTQFTSIWMTLCSGKGPLRYERWKFPHSIHPAYAIFWRKRRKGGKKTDFFSPCILNKVELGVSEHTQEERVYQKLYVNIVERENNWARNWRLENWLQNGFNILCSLTKRQTGFLLTVGPWPHYSCSISFRKLLIIIFFSAPWRRKSSPNLYQFNQPDMPFLESRKPSLWNIILKKDRVPIPPSSWESRSLSLISRN